MSYRTKYLYTAFCAFPEDKRGQYCEEIDVEADSPTHAKQAAEKRIEADYNKRLKVRRVVRRVPGAYFF
jgi:hypothetical protein